MRRLDAAEAWQHPVMPSESRAAADHSLYDSNLNRQLRERDEAAMQRLRLVFSF
ncbi:hypothetical protein B8V81_4346 [Paenibacillus pasadenensis]|uniref:Uncharacterized protein n=1 Tax=Paenibacillus pasadenensis TaxID=217090 RepID=A0A2N5N6G1_9BACL|nr:hypothetical protein B8V81_4346 [Paenibacillus pasadenensis]